jgi:hypothetical protein
MYKKLSFAALLMFWMCCTSCASGQRDAQNAGDDEVQEMDTFFSQQDTAYMEEEYEFMDQLEQQIVGEWENTAMRVKVWSYQNSDTSFIVDINEDTWDQKMNIKPIKTKIFSNGTYISEFRNSFDSLMYRPVGEWYMDGDSLIMTDRRGTYQYKVFVDGATAEFRSMVDWDGDGKSDDEYFGTQRKIDDTFR